MCNVFSKTKQAYYKQTHQNTKCALTEDKIVGLVKEKRKIWKRGSGRNLHQSLHEDFKMQDIKLGRDKFFDILRNHNLLIKTKRTRTKTTCSYHHFNKHSNLVKGYIALRCNEVWVSDITYIWLKELDSFCYLSLVTDLYSRKIVGYCVYENLSVKGCLEALQMALQQRKNKAEKLIHHSDRGVQYCSHSYVRLLQKNNIHISMTQTGDPKENAIAERVHRTIKEEFTNDRQINFCNIAIAKVAIKKFIEFYNQHRPHRSVNWLTPNKAHLQKGILQRKWKAYYAKSIWGDLVEA